MGEPARKRGSEPHRSPRSRVRRALEAVTGGGHSAGFDPIVHERVRLAILSSLAVASPLTFNEMKSLLDISDGNLSVHARKLEEAGYIEIRKRFEGRVPRTEYALTQAGRTALEAYLAHMEALIGAVRR